ncbi:hypothetical protein [Rhodococcus sp. 14C212]|uniref:hypothetical protein n=1 Tax=Rhodococcus sp. 14C212 TaxID=2711209 RepID=UPI001F10B192|nr:hypothetical protein [Rhodococcus sp. 14C212]
MDIHNAYDLTGSYRAAAQLCGCSHNTLKKAVEDRAVGLPPTVRRARLIDDWHNVLEGWVAESPARSAATSRAGGCRRSAIPAPTVLPGELAEIKTRW